MEDCSDKRIKVAYLFGTLSIYPWQLSPNYHPVPSLARKAFILWIKMSVPPPLTAIQIAASGETKWPTILAVLLVGCGLSSTAIILRLITRFAIIRRAGPDDYVIGVAQVWSSDT
jgi:hypothetical protein